MVYLVFAFKVPFLLWTLYIASTHSEIIKGHISDVGIISSFLEQFIKPYVDSIQSNGGKPRSVEETKVEKAIRLKIAALKPMLQDNEANDKPKHETENNLRLNDETTIIEFIPKKKKIKKEKSSLREIKHEADPFHKHINKYKKIRQSIMEKLEKEKTSSSTRKLITRTLDEMIAQLIERQCTWKSVDTSELKKPKKTHNTVRHVQKLSDKDWMSLRKQYLEFLEHKNSQEADFMKEFHDVFSNVINDTFDLSNRYKVRCQLVKVKSREEKPFLRRNKSVEKYHCKSFKVCSDELKDFLTNFYSYLNDTAVSTLRNYAAMYIRDVKEEVGVDKDIVVSVLENISNAVEQKVAKIFRKKLDSFTLDEKKKERENIRHISDFITATTTHLKNVLKNNLDHELGAMKTKLFTTVREDLDVNLKVDLDNLGKLFVDRICSLFEHCNGKYAARRLDEPWTFRPKDTEDIYVKVQLTLDDELKDSFAQFDKKPWQAIDMRHRLTKNLKNIDEMNYTNLTVTRTTLAPTNVTSATNNFTSYNVDTTDSVKNEI